MDIVKNLKDYKLSHKQRVFAGFLKEKVDTYTCCETIKNRAFLRQHFSPTNDFVVYNTAIACHPRLLTKYN